MAVAYISGSILHMTPVSLLFVSINLMVHLSFTTHLLLISNIPFSISFLFTLTLPLSTFPWISFPISLSHCFLVATSAMSHSWSFFIWYHPAIWYFSVTVPAIIVILWLLVIVMCIVLTLSFSHPHLLLHYLFLLPFLDHKSSNMFHSVILIYGVIWEFELFNYFTD